MAKDKDDNIKRAVETTNYTDLQTLENTINSTADRVIEKCTILFKECTNSTSIENSIKAAANLIVNKVSMINRKKKCNVLIIIEFYYLQFIFTG